MRFLAQIAMFFCFTAAANAAFELPHVGTAAEVKEFKAMIAEEAPWYREYGGMGHVDNMVGGSKKLVPWLEANKEWQSLAAERPARRTITITSMKEGYEQGRTVRKEVATLWVAEVNALIAEFKNPDALFAKVLEEVEWISSHDVRALMTGLINSIPGIDKGKIFKLGSPAEQLTALKKEAGFTDENLAKNFRAAAFGLEANQVTRKHLIEMAQESLDREAKLPKLLRAAWAALKLTKEQLGKLVRVAPLKLDVFGQQPEDIKSLFDKIGLTGKTLAYVQRQLKNYVNEEDYVVDKVKVMVPDVSYIVEEVTPAIGGTRGCLMQECSLEAYGFSYTPTEFVFLVRDSKGKPKGFMSATRVKVKDGDALFVHDFGGQDLLLKAVDAAMYAIYMNKDELGVQEITFSGNNGNSGDYDEWVRMHGGTTRGGNGTGGVKLKQTYYDVKIRDKIQQLIGYTHDYDLGTYADNLSATAFRPNDLDRYSIQVELTDGVPAMPEELSNSELLLKALGILQANPEAGLSSEMRAVGMHPGELAELMRVLQNMEGLSLADYYASLKEYFGNYGINMSRNFVRDHEYMFQEGHLNSSDALTTADATHLNQTVRFVVNAFKHAKDLEPLFKMAEANKEFLADNEIFTRYIKSFTGYGAREDMTMERLMGIGFDFDYILKNKEASAKLVAGKSSLVRLWILENMKPAQLRALPVEIVRLVAKDLGVDDDSIPDRASQILMYTVNTDEKVLKELKRSGKDEVVTEIAMRTAVLFFEAGGDSDAIAKRIRKEESSQKFDAELRKRLDAFLSKQKDCEDRAVSTSSRRRAG